MAQDATQFIPLEYLNRTDSTGRPQVARLKLYTHKPFSGGLASSANVEFVGAGFVTFEMFGDFSARLLHVQGARATQKAIDAQHAKVFTPEVVAKLQEKVKAHYAAKDAAKVAKEAERKTEDSIRSDMFHRLDHMSAV